MKLGELVPAAAPLARRLWDNTGGSLTIPAIVFFTVLMAVGGLAIDLQRLYGVHGTMQAYVDDVALAAAAELDSQSGALTRAVNVACGATCPGGGGAGVPLVAGPANSAQFATVTTLTVQKITFLTKLDADPGPLGDTPTTLEMSSVWAVCKYDNGTWYQNLNGSWSPNNCRTNAGYETSVHFVEVVAAPRTVSYLILPVANVLGQVFSNVLGQASGSVDLSGTVHLRATAGRREEICNAPPLFFCNPNEAGGNLGAGFNLVPGKNIRGQVQTSDLQPGDWGVVDIQNLQNVSEAMALLNPNTQCFSNIAVKPGVNAGPVRDGLNTRMDMGSDATHPPAPNVTKGSLPQQVACNSFKISAQTIPFPRDNCFMASPTPNFGQNCLNGNDGQARVGDGKWARTEYWNQNHPGDLQPPGYIDPLNPNGGMSRYDVYQYEINTPKLVNLDEKGAPVCSAPYVNANRDRRVIYAAVVNCLQNAAAINTHAAIPSNVFAKLFLTEPVANTLWDGAPARGGVAFASPPNGSNIFVEMMGVVPPNDVSGALHIYPVLYR